MAEMITFTGYDGSTLSITPSSMKWSLMDISAADSGRGADGTMWKNRVCMKRKLEFEFNGLTWAEVAPLIRIVSGTDANGNFLNTTYHGQYFYVTYPDMLTGTTQTRTFYVGDRECPVYTWWDNQKVISTVSFNCIEA